MNLYIPVFFTFTALWITLVTSFALMIRWLARRDGGNRSWEYRGL